MQAFFLIRLRTQRRQHRAVSREPLLYTRALPGGLGRVVRPERPTMTRCMEPSCCCGDGSPLGLVGRNGGWHDGDSSSAAAASLRVAVHGWCRLVCKNFCCRKLTASEHELQEKKPTARILHDSLHTEVYSD